MNIRCTIAMLAIPIATAGRCEAQAPLPPDLAAVPADALGFVHVRVADIWKSDALKEFRETVLQAGDEALAAFDKRFLPAPSSIDRLTVVVFPQDADFARPPTFCAILSFNKPFDQAQALKSALPDVKEKKTANGSYWVAAKSEIAVSFVADRLIVVGPVPGLEKFMEKRPAGPGALTDALRSANSTRQITVAANLGLIPAKALEAAPPPVQPLLRAKAALLNIDLNDLYRLDLELIFADETAAAAGLTAVEDLAKMGRGLIKNSRDQMLNMILGDGKIAPLDQLPTAAVALAGLGDMEVLDALLATPPVKRDRNAVKLSASAPGVVGDTAMTAIGIGLLLPAVQQVRVAAGRISSTNKLKQIGLAMHNYHDTNGALPPAAICDKNGKPLLSWRVAILPFIDEQELYNKFKLDEPWDSENNKKLIPLMPKTYNDPMLAPPAGMTNYRVIYGKDCAIGLQKSLTLLGIADGCSNTGLVFQMADTTIWTKPDDFEYDKNKPLPKVFPYASGFLVLLADASVRSMPRSTTEKTVRLIIEANDGQVVPFP
jgi:Protein of unknown function (DUF1559)